MNILYIHQSFPGQYQNIVKHLENDSNIRQIALGAHPTSANLGENIQYFLYQMNRGNTPNIHPLALETESKVIRGEACANAALSLKEQGFKPDLICAHPGWGESLFLKSIWPNTPILLYQEFYYQLKGFDLNFDPETQPPHNLEKEAKAILKNNCLLTSLEQSSWNVCPTNFQRSSFPTHWQQYISTIHDGIDEQQARPDSNIGQLKLPSGDYIQQEDTIVTFVNRTLEPYRGYHTFVRAIPEIQNLCPEAKIVIVGETKGVSYGAPCPKGEWKDHFLEEIDGKYDPSGVYFTGKLEYKDFLHLLKLSNAHAYLTYPFVLSWSLLEAMSTECAIVGSKTAPVQELITHGNNGLLVDFFDHQGLAESIAELLKNRNLAKTLGRNARKTVLKDYTLKQCVSRHLALMNLVASGALSRYQH